MQRCLRVAAGPYWPHWPNHATQPMPHSKPLYVVTISSTALRIMTESRRTPQGHNPWRRVMNYIIPVVIFSAIFNIPKFLEIETEVVQDER